MSEEKTIREAAEEYCRSQIATMYGTAEAGINKIGTDAYEQMVQEIVALAGRKRGQ